MRSNYGIEITYNDAPPLVQYSPDRGGVSVHLYNSNNGELALKAQQNVMGEIQRWWLKSLRVGDRLTFRYLEVDASPDPVSTMHKLGDQQLQSRQPDTLPAGERLGLDINWRSNDVLRCAYPDNGGFSLILTNAPITTVRGFVMAGNETESWSWEFADLSPNEACHISLVSTDRWDKPHRHVNK